MLRKQRATRGINWWFLTLSCWCLPLVAVSQLSTPIAHSRQLKEVDAANKYRSRKADLDKDGDIQHEGPVPGSSHCGRHRLDLAWMTEASSSVYATPLITDLHADGRRDIVVPSFVHYLEVLEGTNGGQAVGWPAFHASSVHASPLLYDIDFDGVRDIMLATYDGQIIFYKDTGERLAEGIQVSRLRVRKDWFVGLDPKDPFDHSHPDVGDGEATDGQAKGDSGAGRALEKKQQQQQRRQEGGAFSSPQVGDGGDAKHSLSMEDRVKRFVRQITEYRQKYGDLAADKLMEEARATNALFYEAVVAAIKQILLQQQLGNGTAGAEGATARSPTVATGANTSRRRLMQATDPTTTTTSTTDANASLGGSATVEGLGSGEAVSDEAAHSFDIFEEEQLLAADDGFNYGGDNPELHGDDVLDFGGDAFGGSGFHEDGVGDGLYQVDAAEAAADIGGAAGGSDLDSFLARVQYDEFGDLESTTEFRESDAALHEHGVDPRAANPDELQVDAYGHLYLGDYHLGGSSRGWGNEDFAQTKHPDASGGYVYVDPHIMTTPAIADIDGDGHDELVVAVSYFYDREYYDDPEHAKDLKGIDVSKYVASGVVVFDLRTRTEKWVQHLDLSTDTASYKAYAYSSPTLVDLDGNSKLEIVVGTSMGFLYVLDYKGGPVAGWPIQMGEIQAQPLVADINNDGDLEIFISDMRGNLAAFNTKGEEVWERHVRSAVSQGAVAGDIDGDGQLEVVAGTASGFIYALAGSTGGSDIPNWPYRARGRVQAGPTISQLVDGTGMQVIVPAFDGFLYVLDGLQGCADVVDMGETSYAAVLVDDIDGDGALELVATTMNGNVYSFETGAPYHPLKTWTSQVMGPNGQVARYGYAGIFATPSTRRPRDVAGDRLQIQFEVVDKRVAFADNGTLLPGGRGPYNVTVVLKGVGVREMAAGDAPVVGVADSFPGPGRYSVDIPCPKAQASAVVRLELVDSSGLLYSDEFALSFHMHFHRLLKWAIALPLGLMLAVLLAGTGQARTHSA